MAVCLKISHQNHNLGTFTSEIHCSTQFLNDKDKKPVM